MSFDIENLGTNPSRLERFEYIGLGMASRIDDVVTDAGAKISDFMNNHAETRDAVVTVIQFTGAVAISAYLAVPLAFDYMSKRFKRGSGRSVNGPLSIVNRRQNTVFASWINGK